MNNSLKKLLRPKKSQPRDRSSCSIFICDFCEKSFTTKFNVKRHMNLHCDAAKAAGVPIQGPPSAFTTSKWRRERKLAFPGNRPQGISTGNAQELSLLPTQPIDINNLTQGQGLSKVQKASPRSPVQPILSGQIQPRDTKEDMTSGTASTIKCVAKRAEQPAIGLPQELSIVNRGQLGDLELAIDTTNNSMPVTVDAQPQAGLEPLDNLMGQEVDLTGFSTFLNLPDPSPFLSNVLNSQFNILDDSFELPDNLFESDDDNLSSILNVAPLPPISNNSLNVVNTTTTENHCLPDKTMLVPGLMEPNQSINDQPALQDVPATVQLEEIPKGWTRQVITIDLLPGYQKIFFYDAAGKKFTNEEEICKYFESQGKTVKAGLFDFHSPGQAFNTAKENARNNAASD